MFQVICEVETDKTSVPVPSPVAGVIEELLVEDGSTVNPGMKLAKIKVGAGGGAPSAAKPKAQEEAPAAPPAATKPKAQEEAPAAPPPTPKSTEGAIPSAPPAAPPLPPAQPMKSIPVAAIRHAQAMETPAHAPPPPPSASSSAGAAPIVKMPPSDPTKEIAGTRSEHRVKYSHSLTLLARKYSLEPQML